MSYKIVDLPDLGRPFNATDIIEVSDDGNGSYKANIGNFTLSGTNYLFVNANGTPDENGAAVRTAYTTAQAMTPNGSAKSETNRVVILLSPGYYSFNEAALGIFTVNVSFIDFESLSGVPDVYFSSMQVTSIGLGTDVRISGIDTTKNSYLSTGPFAIAATAAPFENIYIKNCVGGDFSFGSFSSAFYGTIDSCYAGKYSFGYVGLAAPIGILSTSGGSITNYGTIRNCSAGNYSFISSEGPLGSMANNSGTITNCTAGNYSFVYTKYDCNNYGTITNCTATGYAFCCTYNSGATNTAYNNGYILNCKSGVNSFVSGIGASSTIINYGTIMNCIATDGSFAAWSNGLSGYNYGKLIDCNAADGSKCFMCNNGYNNGYVLNCIAIQLAFCCDNPLGIGGDIYRCTMTGDNFTVGTTAGGRVVLGIDPTGIINY